MDGEILVTLAIGEAFNAMLHLAGAIVTDHEKLRLSRGHRVARGGHSGGGWHRGRNAARRHRITVARRWDGRHRNVALVDQIGRPVSAFTIIGIALASALVPLNSTMIAVALPTLAREFDIYRGHAAILVTVYLGAMLIGQPVAGRIADSIGARRLGIIAVSGFGVCSAAAMFAPTFAVLVTCRGAPSSVCRCAVAERPVAPARRSPHRPTAVERSAYRVR